ncbi:hypothetical protein [Streptomyces milbemycinicus]|uniref:Uncharacterized protein n=1 Tax=Streptomyces milbemycinicus TaxID=476552 RepID=A0ABW8M3Z8_9ACTN
MNHTSQPHPGSWRFAALIAVHGQANGNSPDPAGKIAGYDSLALLEAAGHGAQQMLEGHGTLRKTLNPQQIDELRRLLAAMWQDGFTVGVRSR